MNNGLLNEFNFIDLINTHVKNGYRNFVFKGGNSVYAKYDNITKAIKYMASTNRRDEVFCKADVLLIDKNGRSYPISIKMHDVSITWESADGTFKEALYDFSRCYGKPILPYGKRLIIPLEGDLSPFVFGDDIMDGDGIITIQKFDDTTFVPYSNNTVIINTNRNFKCEDDVDNDRYYKPCLAVRSDPKRNISDDLISGYKIEVAPIGDCFTMTDLIDQIKFK